MDIIFEIDLVDALKGIEKPVYENRNFDVAVWLSIAGVAKSWRLGDFGQDKYYEVSSSLPVISTSIRPQGIETLTIVPYQHLGDTMVACLGLIDKYAGLAAIQSSQTIAGKLCIDFSLNGVAGFLVALGVEDAQKRVRVTVDNISTLYVIESKGIGLCLVEVDLASIQAVLGKETWTVEIQV